MTDQHPEAYTLRPTTPDDLAGVVAVRRQQEYADWGDAHTTEENLRQQWQGINLAHQSCVAVDAGGRIVGYGQVYNATSASPVLAVAVHPDHQRQGLGKLLLRVIEAQARKLLARTDLPPEKTRSLVAQVSGRNPAAQNLLRNAGYAFTSAFHVMEARLTTPPQPPAPPSGIVLHDFVPGRDDQAVYEADEEAFLDERGKTPRTFARWTRRMNMVEGFDPSLWLIAWDGDVIAGLMLCEVERGKGRIHHLGVRRPYRRRGLGMCLLKQMMLRFWERDIRNLILNVDAESLTGANRLYELAGFEVSNRYINYRKPV